MWQADAKHAVEVVVVIVVGLVIWLAADGALIPPMMRGTAKMTEHRQDFSRFSLRTVFVVMTLLAAVLGLGVLLTR